MEVRTISIPAAIVAGLCAASGCGGSGAGVDRGGPLTGRTFLSEAVTRDGAPVQLVEGTRIALEFTRDGQLVATAGCNSLSHKVSITEDRLDTTGGGATEIGCDPLRHEQDTWLAEFLTSSPTWRLDGDYLTLTAGGTELELLDREVADPDRPLSGTRWIVDTIVTGQAASSLVAGTEGSAWLLIDGDSFTASSGCRDLSGRVSVGVGRLEFMDTAQTGRACPPELVEVDEAVRAVLAGPVEFAIEAARLRLDHPDGPGLGLHAGE
jgi:heat shock protein HslJ